MLKLIDKLNPINFILRLLFRVRWNPLVGDDYWLSVHPSDRIYIRNHLRLTDLFLRRYGWHKGFPWSVSPDNKWGNCIFTTYGEWEWKPNSRIDFYMSLDSNMFNHPQANTSAWGIKYYEPVDPFMDFIVADEFDPSMHEIDVVEIVNGNKLLFHVHTRIPHPEGERVTRGHHMKLPKGFNLREKHLYSVKWMVKRFLGVKIVYIIHYINNIPVQILTNLFSRLPDRSIYPVISYGEDCTEWVQYRKI
jgi:hypothetical protein